jgi:osmoprotectant transport system permease protein
VIGGVIGRAIGGTLVGSHAPTVADDCLIRNAWVCPEYVRTRAGDLGAASLEHLRITVISVVLGAAIALPLALLARRIQRLRATILGAATAIYTIPSLALFSLLLPFTGLSDRTVIVGLTLYTLTILVRAVLSGLEGVPEEVRDAARGMGYSPSGLLWRVELPLALPVLIGGLRIATVSTVALTTIGMIVGSGGLGNLIQTGLQSNFKAQVLTASVLCVVIALVLDLVLLGVQRVLMPWRRAEAA